MKLIGVKMLIVFVLIPFDTDDLDCMRRVVVRYVFYILRGRDGRRDSSLRIYRRIEKGH